MGAHKNNPMAEGFIGFKPGAPLPPVVVGARVDTHVVASLQWLADNRREIARAEAEGKPMPACPAEHADARIVLVGTAMVPLATVKDWRDYPYGEAPIAELVRIPWASRKVGGVDVPGFRDLIVQLNPHMEQYLGKLGSEIVSG